MLVFFDSYDVSKLMEMPRIEEHRTGLVHVIYSGSHVMVMLNCDGIICFLYITRHNGDGSKRVNGYIASEVPHSQQPNSSPEQHWTW